MAHVEQDEARERRIADEIVVDAYSEEEQLAFPFKAKCTSERRISPLEPEEVVEVIGMVSEDDCMHEMFVEVRWQGRAFGVPLSQLEGISVDEETQEAFEDWYYWLARGYQL